MRPGGLKRSQLLWPAIAAALMLGIRGGQIVRAEAPAVTIGPGGVKVRVVAASLADTLDALARAGGFRVMYQGPRPAARLFNAEIETPTVPQTLFRILEGQNLNYGVVLDPSGTKVTYVLIVGTIPKPGTTAEGARPQAPATPRTSQPAVEEDEVAEEPEPEPAAPEPTATPPPLPANGRPAPASPFGPRSPFLGPFGPRPSPSLSPSPLA